MLTAATIISLPPTAQAASGKLILIVLENQRYSDIVGSPNAPYIASLISQGKLFTNYTAVINGSKPNYLAMTSGLLTIETPPSPNIFQAIDATGGARSWMSFQESMPGNCWTSDAGTVPGMPNALYAKIHDPASLNRGNNSCAQHDIPMTTTSFNPSALPDFSYIIPNQCDDMHTLPSGGQPCPAFFGSNTGSTAVGMGDHWLSVVVPQLLAQPGVTVIITWDEGTKSSGEHIATVEVGAGVTQGSTDATAYNHYGLEAGLYAAFGLGTAPNNGASATPLPLSLSSGTVPTITSFSPTSGAVGTTVTIYGTNFTAGAVVKFNGVTGTGFVFKSATKVKADLPAGATTGPISVTTTSGTATSSISFVVPSGVPPTITSFSPTSGAVGTTVTISGTNFTAGAVVKFNGVTGTGFVFNSATDVQADVPTGATTGPISVTTTAGTATSSTSFNVSSGAPPTFKRPGGVSPNSGAVGTVVTISGTGFTGTTSVTFGGVPATFAVNSDTTITANVPSGAITGKITVTTPFGSGSSAAKFTVV